MLFLFEKKMTKTSSESIHSPLILLTPRRYPDDKDFGILINNKDTVDREFYRQLSRLFLTAGSTQRCIPS